ncbi:MAG: hypothetical protein ACYC41_09180 [Bacillota bacterium]
MVAGAGTLSVLDALGTVMARTPLPADWPCRVAAAAEPGPTAAGAGSRATAAVLIAVVQGRPATAPDRLGFRGPWRSAPPLVGGRVTLYRFVPGALIKLWDGPGPSLNPWWVGFGDFTGSGRPALLTGVWKTAVFDPFYDRRPFVYGLYPQPPAAGPLGSSLTGASGLGFQPFPQWLGSRLSNPFVDLAAGDADGDGRDEIVAVTIERDGGFAVSTYDWSGFGFVLGARVTGFRRVAGVTVLSPGRLAVVGRGTTGGDQVFTFVVAAGASTPEAVSDPDTGYAPDAGSATVFLPTGSAQLPASWNRPGAVSVRILGDNLTVEVTADGRTSLLTAHDKPLSGGR